MPDTEMDTTFVKLTLISKRAHEEPKCQFTSLAHLLNQGYLKACYKKLGRQRMQPGCDHRAERQDKNPVPDGSTG